MRAFRKNYMSKKKFSLLAISPKKSLAGLLCAGLLFTTAPAIAQSGAGVDARLEVPVTREAFPDHSSVLMLDDIRFTVYPDRSHAFDEHDAVKVLDQDGVDDNATLVRVVDVSKSSVEVLMARTIKADGRILKAPPPQYSSLAPDSKVYDSVKRFALRFPDVEVGDIVEFHLRTTHKPKPGGHFWATTYVQNPMPILDSTFTVTVPENVTFRTATPGHPESKPEETAVEKDGQTFRQLEWKVQKEAAYEFKPLAPKAISLLKRIEVSSFESWEQVAEFLKEDWDAHNQLSEGLFLRIAGWMPDSGEIQERAETLTRELNRDHKVASFLAEEPEFHNPDKVAEEKLISSGDSSLLTSAALSGAGIPNIPVMTFGVNAQSLADELPIPEKVAKIVLEIPRPGEESLWYDPETPGFILEGLPSNTSETAAISWDRRFQEGRQGLADLDRNSAFENREELAIEGRLEKTGQAELTLQYDRYGASALDSRRAARDISEGAREARDRALSTFFRNTTRAYGPRARLLGRYFELDSESADPFSLSFTVSVPGYAQIQNSTMLVPLPRFLSSSLRAAARDRNRETPIVFEQPYQQDVRIHLIFPKGSEVSTVPESIRESTPEAEFVATGRSQGNEVWYVGRLTVFDPWIEEDALDRSLAALSAALKSEDTILKVQLSPVDAAAGPVEESTEAEENDT